MKRTILHVDLNAFYANVEILYRPELRDLPVVVTGDVEARHGIILAKNQQAKQFDIKTGEAIWQAKQKCPKLICLPADYRKYLRFSRLAKAICADYTDRIESFGIDESWLDIGGSAQLFGTGQEIADAIRRRFREEIGITASVGVSYNKIFAKLGSDMKKPDATTVITAENFRETVWLLPVEDLLYVGRATQRKLNSRMIQTIGDLANADLRTLKLLLGVWGEMLHQYANGLDNSSVRLSGEESIVKSIGNSTTATRDLVNENDVKMVFYVLAESVAARLRQSGLKCKTIAIGLRNTELFSFERQGKLSAPTFVSTDLVQKAMELFRDHYRWERPLRSIGIRGSDLVTADRHIQIGLFDRDPVAKEKLEKTVDEIRRRFGHESIQRCMLLQDRKLTGINPKEDHIIHPIAFLR
ncbi:MAG: polymerase [Firmicutes bacterium]|nr:polymerase [Bacillota bacterium]